MCLHIKGGMVFLQERMPEQEMFEGHFCITSQRGAIEVSIVGWRAQPTNNKLQKNNSVFISVNAEGIHTNKPVQVDAR